MTFQVYRPKPSYLVVRDPGGSLKPSSEKIEWAGIVANLCGQSCGHCGQSYNYSAAMALSCLSLGIVVTWAGDCNDCSWSLVAIEWAGWGLAAIETAGNVPANIPAVLVCFSKDSRRHAKEFGMSRESFLLGNPDGSPAPSDVGGKPPSPQVRFRSRKIKEKTATPTKLGANSQFSPNSPSPGK